MKYKNTDNTVLDRILIGQANIGEQIVFHNDGLVEDIHVIRASDGSTVITEVRVKDTEYIYAFAHDFDRPCYLLKYAPSRIELLFDEED